MLKNHVYKNTVNVGRNECNLIHTDLCFSGCVGADNLDEKDNVKEPFHPYTVKRVNIPRYSETGQ
jgi:hypothetical protein